MTQEDIYKELQSNLDEPDNEWDSIFNSGYSRGFVDAVKWRIDSVWHNDTVKPDPNNGDLLVGIEVMGKTAYIRQNAHYVIQFGCIRWAYIKDLIPNTEE